MSDLQKITLVIAFMILAISCGSDKSKLRVMAASSLAGAFGHIAESFEVQNPDVDVKVEFAGSQRLRHQLEFGAKADIFASADHTQMKPLSAANLLNSPSSDFASNILVLIARPGGPVNSIIDLAKPGIKLVLAQSNVPAGKYSREVLDNLSLNNRSFKNDVLSNLVSEEPNVRNVAQKVALGEVDAGIVYLSDVTAVRREGNVNVIEFPSKANVEARYPIAVLKHSGDKVLAQKFLDFVMSVPGQRALANHGFSAP